MKYILFVMLLFICAPHALFSDEPISDTAQTQERSDNIQEDKQKEAAYSSLPEEITKESADNDSLPAAQPPRHTKLNVVHREHDYKRQAWMAVGMMAFLAIILGTSQSWNPR